MSSSTNYVPKRPAPPAVSPVLSMLQSSLTRGYNYMDYALTHDENKNHEKAIQQYKQGISIFEEALLLNSTGFNAKTQPKSKAEEESIDQYRLKITKYLSMAQGRCQELEKEQRNARIGKVTFNITTSSNNKQAKPKTDTNAASYNTTANSLADSLKEKFTFASSRKPTKTTQETKKPARPDRPPAAERIYTGFSRGYPSSTYPEDVRRPKTSSGDRPPVIDLTKEKDNFSDDDELLPSNFKNRPKWNQNYTPAAKPGTSYVSPYSQKSTTKNYSPSRTRHGKSAAHTSNTTGQRQKPTGSSDIKLDYTGLDKKLVIQILDEIAILPKNNKSLTLEHVAGNVQAKQALNETVILPALNPTIFKGLRAPPKGILLFGPPGCGKTLMAKALASQTSFTFFNISASSLTSKWVGEGEKLVKTLFNIARQLQPTIIFMDEIDSILTERKSTENEASRRLKTEFMLQFDGMVSTTDEQLLVLAATNRPQELDDAVLRRFPKRIYIKLPDPQARTDLLNKLLQDQPCQFSSKEFADVIKQTEGYSGSDLAQLAKEAAYEPIRNLDASAITTMSAKSVPPIKYKHFTAALTRIRPSVSNDSLKVYIDWTAKFGDISSCRN